MQIRELNWEDNPSDDGSKGLELDALTKNDRWLTGPNFLWEKEEHWSMKIEIPCIVNDVPYISWKGESDLYHSSW